MVRRSILALALLLAATLMACTNPSGGGGGGGSSGAPAVKTSAPNSGPGYGY